MSPKATHPFQSLIVLIVLGQRIGGGRANELELGLLLLSHDRMLM